MRKTVAARASEASSAVALSVGDADEVPERAHGVRPLPVAAQPVPEGLGVDGGVGGVDPAQRGRGPRPREPLAPRHRVVAQQCPGEVRRRHVADARETGQRGGWAVAPQPRGGAPGRSTVTSSRSCSVVEPRDAEPVEQPAVGGAAAQEDVLAGVDVAPLRGGRSRSARRGGTALEQHDRVPGVRSPQRGGEAGEPAADDGDAWSSAPGERAHRDQGLLDADNDSRRS